jgi:hypothetical protein
MNRSRGCLQGLLPAAMVAWSAYACSPSSTAPPVDAIPDADGFAGETEPPIDAAPEADEFAGETAPPIDLTPGANGFARDGGGSCTETIEAYCHTDAGTCLWSAAQDPAQWCNPADSLYPRVYLYRDCAGFDVVELIYIDAATDYYYDAASGRLVRVEGRSAPGVSYCLAGQGGLVEQLTACADYHSSMSICSADASGD